MKPIANMIRAIDKASMSVQE